MYVCMYIYIVVLPLLPTIIITDFAGTSHAQRRDAAC